MIEELLADLEAEAAALGTVVLQLDGGDWDRVTPAPGWTIRDQLTHLAFFDDALHCAIVDPAAFALLVDEVRATAGSYSDAVARRYRHLSGAEVVTWFDAARKQILADAGPLDDRARVPWFNGEKALATMLSLRLVETWAHGQDVVDAIGTRRIPTARLRHIARLGHRTIAHSFVINDRPRPAADVRLELDSPDGATWVFGDADAPDVVRGPAEDLCLVVTQRRHVADTTLSSVGPVASEWLTIAQIFAGAPGPGRLAGQFTG
jgi:uncharacterized protein (TIGR03084 family)